LDASVAVSEILGLTRATFRVNSLPRVTESTNVAFRLNVGTRLNTVRMIARIKTVLDDNSRKSNRFMPRDVFVVVEVASVSA
jgi:hypothetical protein